MLRLALRPSRRALAQWPRLNSYSTSTKPPAPPAPATPPQATLTDSETKADTPTTAAPDASNLPPQVQLRPTVPSPSIPPIDIDVDINASKSTETEGTAMSTSTESESIASNIDSSEPSSVPSAPKETITELELESSPGLTQEPPVLSESTTNASPPVDAASPSPTPTPTPPTPIIEEPPTEIPIISETSPVSPPTDTASASSTSLPSASATQPTDVDLSLSDTTETLPPASAPQSESLAQEVTIPAQTEVSVNATEVSANAVESPGPVSVSEPEPLESTENVETALSAEIPDADSEKVEIVQDGAVVDSSAISAIPSDEQNISVTPPIEEEPGLLPENAHTIEERRSVIQKNLILPSTINPASLPIRGHEGGYAWTAARAAEKAAKAAESSPNQSSDTPAPSPPKTTYTEAEYTATQIHGRGIFLPWYLPRTTSIPVASIQFRSHQPKLLELFIHFASHAGSALGIPLSKTIYLPTKRSLWTVLKSPFVYKTSQENYERTVHKRMIKAWDADAESVDKWIAYLKKNSMAGVGMRITRWERAEVGVGVKMLGDVVMKLDQGNLTTSERVKELSERIIRQEMAAIEAEATEAATAQTNEKSV